MIASPIEPAVQSQLDNKILVDEELWDRLVNRITTDHDMPRQRAEEIVDQTLGFLVLASREPETRFSPSALVDIGWHTFLLYTWEYNQFCTATLGRFIHHWPNDKPGRKTQGLTPSQTAHMMESSQISVIDHIWDSPTADCGVCNDGYRNCAG